LSVYFDLSPRGIASLLGCLGNNKAQRERFRAPL
jgi:hypothetical protein